jgi:hypothetical protein
VSRNDWRGLGHPDDQLRRLARGRRGPVSPPVYRSYRRGPDPVRRARGALSVLVGVFVLVAGVPFLFDQHRIVVKGKAVLGAVRSTVVNGSVITVETVPAAAVANAQVKLDGQPIALTVKDGVGRIRLPALEPGEHRISVSSGSRMLWRGPAKRTVRFVVDDQRPTLTVDPVSAATDLQSALSVSGIARDAPIGSKTLPVTVTVNGVSVPVDSESGRFTATFKRVPTGALRVVVTDVAGYSVAQTMDSGVSKLLPELRMVHVSADAWSDQIRRDALIGLAEQGRITAVMLDIKAPTGLVAHLSGVPLAKQLGAVDPKYDLRAAVAQMKAAGIIPVGRISVFQDPVLATAAVKGGTTRQVVLDQRDQPAGGEPQWTNPLDQDVRNYNLAIAREAAEAGVQVIMFDQLQRPPGPIAELQLPEGDTLDRTLVGFMTEAASVLGDTATRIGVMVEVAADSPEFTAQPLVELARAADYVAPVVFPIRWTKGSFDVVDPVANPYTIVYRSLPTVMQTVQPTGVRVVPVLQDFSVRLDYGRKQVAAQIQGVADRCLTEFMLWDPKGTYVARSLPSGRPVPGAEQGAACKSDSS